MSAAAETIYALSSGRPPAAIAIIRISGPAAADSLRRTSGTLPEPRRAKTAKLHDPVTEELLDHALLLWLPGPESATGEDVAELHLHGGRAVVDGVMAALAKLPGLRVARPGEFTRRAFDNGRIDLNQAEGLADLLAAETAGQRRAALAAAGGMLSRKMDDWRTRLLETGALIEASIDFAEDGEVSDGIIDDAENLVRRLVEEMETMLAQPLVERLKDGVRVVVAGPPNVGKSSLVNALSQRDAAIESAIAGTTRDIIEVPVLISGVPFVLIDTAGLRDTADDVEAIGVQRAYVASATADIVIWLGNEAPPFSENVIAISAKSDVDPILPGRMGVSAKTGQNLPALTALLGSYAKQLLPADDQLALNRRQHKLIIKMLDCLKGFFETGDDLLRAEDVRAALAICDEFTGKAGVEEMLDALFGRFCLGK